MESNDKELELVLFVALRRRQGKSIVAIVSVNVTVMSKIQDSDWSDAVQVMLE